jgi:hypothetical protein
MLKNFFSTYEIDNFELKLTGNINDVTDMNIVWKDRIILKMYPEYRSEQNENLKKNNTKYYAHLWGEKKIYKE